MKKHTLATIFSWAIILWIATFYVEGFPEIGIHAGLRNQVSATSTGWLMLNDWFVDDSETTDEKFKGSFRNDIVLDSKTSVSIPITGIYHISASIPIHNIDTTLNSKFTAAMVFGSENEFSSLTLQSSFQNSIGNINTLTFAGFAQFHAGESIYFQVYSESDSTYYVSKGAKFSIHFIGTAQTAPAFLVQIDNDYAMATKGGEIIKPYLTSGRAKVYSYLTGLEAFEGKYVTACDGVFNLGSNIMVRGGAGIYTLEVLIANEISATYTTEINETSLITLNVFQSFKLLKGVIIQLRLKSTASGTVNVMKYSSWSMGFIGKEISGLEELSTFLPDKQSYTGLTDYYNVLEVDAQKAKTQMVGGTPGQFVSPLDLALQEKVKFQTGLANFFYVSADIHVSGEAEDIEVVIPVGLEKRQSGLPSKGLSGRTFKLKGTTKTISLSGVMIITDGQFVTIYVKSHDKKPFEVLTSTYISIIQVRYLTSSFSVKSAYNLPFTDDQWATITGPFTTVKDKAVFSFGGDFQTSNGKFDASHSGIHTVQASFNFDLTAVVCNASQELVEANLLIDDVRSTTNGFYSIRENPYTKATLRFYGALNLNSGQTVSLRVRRSGCGSIAYEVAVMFSISYIGTQYITPSFLGTSLADEIVTTNPKQLSVSTAENSNITTRFFTDDLFDGTTYYSTSDAIYLVTANVLISDLQCSAKTYIAIRYLVTGTDNNDGTIVFTDKAINIRDMWFGQSGRFTLSMSTSIRLKIGETLKIQLIESSFLDVEFASITRRCTSLTINQGSSISLIRWSSSNQLSQENYVNAGFLARIDSQTTGEPNVWKTFASNSLTSIQANLVGFYDIGDSVSKSSSDFVIDVIRKAGIYYVSGAITLKVTHSNPNSLYELNVQLNKNSETGIYATEWYDVDSNYISISFAGTVYLMYGQSQSSVSINVKGPAGTFYIEEGSTFSVIKLQPDYKTPGIVTEAKGTLLWNNETVMLQDWQAENSKGLTVNNVGFEHEAASYKIQQTGVYFADINIILNGNTTVLSDTYTLQFMDKNNMTNSTSTVVDYVKSGDMLHTTIMSDLLFLDLNSTVYLQLTSPQFVNLNQSMLDGGYSLYFTKSNREFQGIRSLLGSSVTLTTSEETLSGWVNANEQTYYYSGAENATTVNIVKHSGVYVVSFNPSLEHVSDSTFHARIKLNGVVAISATFSSLKHVSIPLSQALQLNIGDTLDFAVESTSASTTVNANDTTRSLVYMGATSRLAGGLSLYKTAKSTYNGYETIVDGWSTTMKGFYMEDNSTLVNKNALAVIKPGFYRITAHVLIKNLEAAQRQFRLEALITDITTNLNNLKSVMNIDGTETGTLIVSSVVSLRKFDTVQFKVLVPVSSQFEVLDGSTASMIVLDDNTGPVQCEDVRISLVNLVSFQRLQVKENVTFTCDSIANKVPENYEWYKDGTLTAVTTSIFTLSSLDLSDSGNYWCRAKFFDTYATTNNATLEVYNPYPIVNVTEGKGYNYTMTENEPAQVLATFEVEAFIFAPKDVKANISLVIISGDPYGDFVFGMPENMTITLSTTRPLDYEKKTFYMMTVRATNLEEPSASGKPGPYLFDFIVNVTVLNINDNPPSFPNELYTTNLPEDYPVAGVVATITATDPDGDALTYRLVSNLSTPFFSIDPNTGVVTLQAGLDRESIVNHTLFIVATDGIHTAVTELFITVTDVNDNNPMFVDSSFVISISEAAYVPHVILKVIAKDPDLGNNSTLTYAIVSGNSEGKFNLDATSGNLSLVAALDYETTTSYTLNISVTDQGTPFTRSSPRNLIVTILVVDNNDNNPVFEKSLYQETISEAFPIDNVILTVRASDNDGTAQYNTEQYKIMDSLANQYFTIFSNGSIVLKQALAYHVYNEFRFAVEAADGNVNVSRHMTTTVIIRVTDENNIGPMIWPSVYNITISEGTSVGTSIGRINATDIDTVGTLSFSASGADSSKFLVASTNGDIVLNSVVDYENVNDRLLTFTASCTDGVATATATVNVIVTDVNDNEPVFGNKYYLGSLREDSLAGTVIATVSASDTDAVNSNEATFRYTIETDPSNMDGSLFSIDPNTGVINLKNNNTLDYEKQQRYQFKVIATDLGTIYNLSGYASVIVHVIDVDDTNPDMHTGFQRINIKESHLINEPLVAFMASDNDTAKNLTYEIVSGNGDGTFKIIGWYLQLAKVLDYESTKNYTLSVIARDDQGHASSAALVEVIVVKVNEHHPTFSTSYLRIEVNENSGLNAIVDLNATDIDQPSSTLMYSLMNTTDFVINSVTGVISNVVELDYERQKSYALVVSVSDQDTPYLQSYMMVDVIVLDRNDLAPYFDPTTINIKISEKAPVNMIIVQLKAYDDDTPYTNLTYGAYSLDNHFSLDTATGVVTLRSEIDLEAPSSSGNYVLTFYVTDGVNMASTNATVRVTVVDRNDNEPIFTMNEYVVYIDENVGLNTEILTVLANDIDSHALSNNLVYSIVPGESSGNFTLGNTPNANKVYTAQTFDFEMVKEYVFMVQANNTDSEDPLTGRALVRVHINDINDNAPKPTQSYTIVNISESTTIGSLVVSIPATDADSTSNGELTYTLKSENVTFTIDGNGEIKLVKELDRFVQNQYTLIVNITDGGSPQKYATVTVIVNIVQAKTNILLTDMERVRIYENTPVGTSILQLNATTRSGQVTYSISNSADASSFIVNSTTGEVTTNGNFDYETKRYYLFQVRVVDRYVNSSGRIQVFVEILDYNDITPTVTSLKVVYNISEATRLNSVIGSLSYTDGDSTTNGEVEFTLLSGDGVGTFGVDTEGYITLNASLDYRVKNMYTLMIKGQDKGTPPLHSNIKITIHVFKANVDFNVLLFAKSHYYICLNEGSVYAGFLNVSATNQNPIVSTTVTYSFATNTSFEITSLFSINPITGSLSINSALDYESRKSYEFVLVATNNENYRDTTSVYVCVNDLNDNLNKLSEDSVSLDLSEVIPVNTLIYRFVILDNDTMDMSASRTFTVDNYVLRVDNNGFVYLNESLDYEIATSHTIVVTVYESGVMQDTATVTLLVSDWNDNKPIYTPTLVRYTVSEDATIGTVVGMVSNATDADATNVNNMISYYLISSTNLFQVHVNGTITVSRSLALTQATDKQHEIVIKAIDNGYLSLIGTIEVIISVADVNNNLPVFASTSYTNTISEEAPVGSTVICVHASDGDFDVGATISYTLYDPTNTFTIDSNTGFISVSSALNYESVKSYTMTVEAVDDQGLKSSPNATLTITITDVNDNLPAFNEDRYHLNLTENTRINTNLMTFSGTDGDLTGNTLTYTIITSDGTSHFQIVGDALQLQTSLDYETRKYYSFLVKATDSATKQLHGRSLVIIDVLDVNDSPPIWSGVSPFNVTISEAHIVMTYVTEIVATDADVTSTLTYTIVSGSDNKFTMQSQDNRGVVSLASAVDYDVKDLYTMTVRVTDGVNSVDAIVNIHITPVNKPEPNFLQTVYEVSIYENTTINTQILVVSYVNAIVPATMMINEAEGGDNFNLASNGALTTKAMYNYEAKSQYVFTITVTDNRRRTGNATIIVNILDINDLCPVVSPSTQTVQITEPTVDNTVVAVVQAYDRDSDNLMFTLVNSSNNVLNNKFKVDQNGGIRADGNIDIENRTVSHLTIFVSDGMCTRNATVIVYVNPVKACPVCSEYQFNEPVYRVSIYENDVKNNLVTVMTNRHSFTNYSIVDVAALAHVRIEELSGAIDLVNAFDYETTKTLEFYVFGVSSIIQNPSQSVTMRARVIITVLDRDDNCPQFTTPMTMSVTYSSPIPSGALIGRVMLNDSDTTTSYMLSVNDTVNFQIDNNGYVRTAQKLESLTQQMYMVNVSAATTTTVGSCLTSSELMLTMTVCPEPMTYMFTNNSNYEETVYENKAVNSNFQIVPKILGPYVAYYSIVEASALSMFHIDTNTGVLNLRGSLDYETERRHVFTVKATILSIFEAYATVIINVLDVNDVCPSVASATIKYRGNPDVNDTIGTLTATDSDSGPSYAIVSGNTGSYFSIDQTTGEINVAKAFPYSFKQTISLTVQVTDPTNVGSCPSTTAVVTIDMESCRNPEDYQFTQARYVMTYYENKTLGELFAVSIRTSAVAHTFQIVYMGDTVQRYSILATTGMISLVMPLDYENSTHYRFEVHATFTDGVVSKAIVDINVLDINDNCPSFSSAMTMIELTEPLKVGLWIARMMVNDMDTDPVNTHAYSISGDNHFAIDQTGLITVRTLFETKRKNDSMLLNLVVSLTDFHGCVAKTHVVQLTIEKVQLYKYLFGKPLYKFPINEDQTAPFLIHCFKNLYGINGTYQLVNDATNSSCFSVSAKGDLKLTKKLDYEAYTHHYLEVSVSYANGLVAYAGVVIIVGNINDNKPQLFPYPPVITINPSFARHTMIGEVDVVDADRPRELMNAFVFSIESGDTKGIFGVSQSGQIYTMRCMSGTDVGIYYLKIKVNDANVFHAYETVTVRVFDVGDRLYSKSCPVKCSDFGNPENYMFGEGVKVMNVSENQAVMSKLLTTDINAFPEANYTLSSHANGYFTIDNNGSIYLAKSLNYEMQKVHYFAVIATIQSRASGTIVTSKLGVMIMVQNVEDVVPMVDAPSQISISELALSGTVVGYIKTKDVDTSMSSITITINTTYPQAISVNNHGEIMVKNISMVPHNTMFPLMYMVSDGKHSASGVIHYKIVDVNNHVPMFWKNVYNFNIDENMIGMVGSVHASDTDVSDSVTYSLDSVSAAKFMFTSSGGNISTRVGLDYESQKIHHLTVMATDAGGYIGVAVVMVVVNNLNDNTPMFKDNDPTLSATINENTLVGSYVTMVSVSDGDNGASLTFDITPKTYFSIDNMGVVKLAKSLTDSDENTHTLQITVTDTKTAIAGILTVTVNRDNAVSCPSLSGFSTKTIKVTESTTVGSILLDLTKLVGTNSASNFMFSLSNTSKYFEIVNGMLRLKLGLDYETSSSYTVHVVAYDKLRNITTVLPLTISINDVDETQPTIVTSAITVSEFTQIGSIVGMIKVTDSDGTSKVTYSITNGDGTFEIDAGTGAITLKKSLDAAVTSSYTLTICAVSSSVQTCKNVTASITNTNSNAPSFGQSTMTITVPQGTADNTVISSKSATDGDGNTITYSINALGDATVNTVFSVNAATGHVTIKDTSIPGTYKFFLIATDGTLSTSVPVTITVPTSSGTAPPHFTMQNYAVSILTTSTEILRVEAKDPPDATLLRYSISGGNTGNVFSIHASSGVISVTSAVQVGQYYKLTVSATSQRTGLTGNATVYVGVGSSIEDSNPKSVTQEVQGILLLLNFSMADFDQSKTVGYYIIGQEYPSTIDVSAQSALEPVTYALALNSTGAQQMTYRYRLYYVANLTVADVVAVKVSRKRRALESTDANSLVYKVGDDPQCTPAQTFCNGPLQGGVRYRFYLAAVYDTNGATPPLLVPSPATVGALTIGGPTVGQVANNNSSIHTNAIVIWVVALVVLGTMFWLAVLAIVILLCYKRRYFPDKAYDLGYNGPPVPRDSNAYSFDNKVVTNDASIHYSDISTIAERQRNNNGDLPKITHAPVILDSPERTPPHTTKLQTYEKNLTTTTFQQEYDTHSAKLKFGDENPEWESMDIQLRIDPTGARDPVITRKDTSNKSKEPETDDRPGEQLSTITTTTTTIRQIVDEDGNVIEEQVVDQNVKDELSRV